MSENKRVYKLDNLRGLAILLVVFGHSIILYSNSWNLIQTSVHVPTLSYIKDIINLIQMPLFFSLSGYLFAYSKKKTNVPAFILAKLKRLLIPYFFFAFFWLIPIRLMLNYHNWRSLSPQTLIIKTVLGGEDNGHLWFLQCLFCCFIVAELCKVMLQKYINHNDKKHIIVWMLAGCLALLIPGKLDIFHVKYNFIYFCLGIVLNSVCSTKPLPKSRTTHQPKRNNIILLIAITLCGTVISLITRNSHISSVTSIFIVVLLYFIMTNKYNRCLAFLGKYSFGIYLFHSPLTYITYTYIPNANPLVVVFINFMLFGSVALMLSIAFSKCFLKIFIGEPLH